MGSHIFDILNFIFGKTEIEFDFAVGNSFETKCFDNLIVNGSIAGARLSIELSLVSWKNEFRCDIVTDKGSVHVRSLCKWGPAKFIIRERTFPSGRPKEFSKVYEQPDPTWEREHDYFLSMQNNTAKQLENNKWINSNFKKIEMLIT